MHWKHTKTQIESGKWNKIKQKRNQGWNIKIRQRPKQFTMMIKIFILMYWIIYDQNIQSKTIKIIGVNDGNIFSQILTTAPSLCGQVTISSIKGILLNLI